MTNALILTIILVTNVLNVELAVSREQKERGMMERRMWEPVDAMLFIHTDQPGRVSYWMKNTYLPMQMLFLDSNLTVMEAYDAKPLSLDLITSESTNVYYVLEIRPEISNLLYQNYPVFQSKMKAKLSKILKTSRREQE